MGDNTMEFKEFAIVLLLAMASEQESPIHMSKQQFTKIVFGLMKGEDGRLSKQQFINACSCLAVLGILNVKKITSESEKRAVKKTTATDKRKMKRMPTQMIGGMKVKGALSKIMEKA